MASPLYFPVWTLAVRRLLNVPVGSQHRHSTWHTGPAAWSPLRHAVFYWGMVRSINVLGNARQMTHLPSDLLLLLKTCDSAGLIGTHYTGAALLGGAAAGTAGGGGLLRRRGAGKVPALGLLPPARAAGAGVGAVRHTPLRAPGHHRPLGTSCRHHCLESFEKRGKSLCGQIWGKFSSSSSSASTTWVKGGSTGKYQRASSHARVVD